MIKEKPNYPFSRSSYCAYSGGKSYNVCQDGDVLVGHERGVTLGEIRMFFYFSNSEKECMYFAEREFRSIFHPFRAPKIWWRKIED